MTAKLTLEQKRQRVLQDVEHALEDRTAIYQQIAQALGEEFLTTERQTDRLVAVMTAHPYWVEDLQQAQEELDDAMRKAVRAGFVGDPSVQEWVMMDRIFNHSQVLRTLHEDFPDLARGMQKPIPKGDMALLLAIDRLRSEGQSWSTIFRLVRNVGSPAGKQRHKHKESLRVWVTIGSDDKKRRSDISNGYHYLYTKRLPPGLRKLVQGIAPRGSEVRCIEQLEDDEDYNVAVIVPDVMSFHEVGDLKARLLRALANYDYEASTPDHYPLTVCNVWRKREWEGIADKRQAEVKQVEQLVEQEASLQATLEAFEPALTTRYPLRQPNRAMGHIIRDLMASADVTKTQFEAFANQFVNALSGAERLDDSKRADLVTDLAYACAEVRETGQAEVIFKVLRAWKDMISVFWDAESYDHAGGEDART